MNIPVRAKMGRPPKDRRRRINIAAAVDYRGKDDDQLFFLFRGASQSLILKVFSFLIGNGKGIAKRAIVTEEHDIVRRNGKGYWRVAVEVVCPNYYFCGLDDMKILIEAVTLKIHPCSFAWMKLEKFLNI